MIMPHYLISFFLLFFYNNFLIMIWRQFYHTEIFEIMSPKISKLILIKN